MSSMITRTDPDFAPGADLVSAGIADLAAGRDTIEAMLVSCAAARLRRLGYAVPDASHGSPENRLYDLVEAQVGPRRAHSRYNALRSRLVSFLDSTTHAPGG